MLASHGSSDHRTTEVRSSQIVLAVDSGGTKTTCSVASIDEKGVATIIGSSRGPGGNPRAIGIEAAVKSLVSTVQHAKADAGLDSLPCHRAIFAIAGTLHEATRRQLSQALANQDFAEELLVVPDLVPLVAQADSANAIGIISGTGSVGIGRNSQGKYVIAGGWGPLVGDDGSGFSIGREALRRTLECLEAGRNLTPLAKEISKAFHASSALEIKSCMAEANDLREFVSKLAPIVLAMPEDEDVREILSLSARDLGNLVETLYSRMEITGSPSQVFMSGGIVMASSSLISLFDEDLKARGIDAELNLIEDPNMPILKMLAAEKLPAEVEFLP